MKLTDIVKKFFYLFLDVSGSLLGMFLIILGWWLKNGRPVPDIISWVVLGLGIVALLIHASHYVIARKHGSEYFYTTRKDK